VIFTASSPFFLFSLFLFPPPFLAFSEAPIASSEALSFALGELYWFNGSTGFFSTSGLIAAPIHRLHPRIRSLPQVLRFDFFKVRFIHFRKLHLLTRHTTVIWASSASICRAPYVKWTTTCCRVYITRLRVDLTRGRVCFTHRRVAAADRRVSAISVTASCRRPPMEFLPPYCRCSIMLFVFTCFLWAFCFNNLLCIPCVSCGIAIGVWILWILYTTLQPLHWWFGSRHPCQELLSPHLRKHCLHVLTFLDFYLYLDCSVLLVIIYCLLFWVCFFLSFGLSKLWFVIPFSSIYKKRKKKRKKKKRAFSFTLFETFPNNSIIMHVTINMTLSFSLLS
jgi:hypothetical protein